jgi:CubicO group peptidase (beta-lactamase class C family)
VAEVRGRCDERFSMVQDTLAANLDAGEDVGASVAVFLDGEPVVDIWGGYADAERTRPWEEDTVTNVFSTTKTMTFLCALLLADRGELDFHAPVARYWPEFKAEGKERVEVRHLMGHTAGLSGWSQKIDAEDLADWEKCTSLLANQAPWWTPGDGSGYHAVTQGYLVGEVVRRICGETIGTFFAREIAGPAGADFHIGTPPEVDGRIARLIPHEPVDLSTLGPPDSIPVRTLTNPQITGETSWHEWWRRAEIPAANGHGNARSVAKIQSVLAGSGEARGVRLLSAAGCEPVFEEQANGTDRVLSAPFRIGMGYGLGSDVLPLGPRACFWGGYGGSLIVNDLERRLTVCYVMNRMALDLVGDRRGAGILLATVASLANTSS